MLFIVHICFFFVLMIRRPPISTRTYTLFPYTTLFRSQYLRRASLAKAVDAGLAAVAMNRDFSRTILGPRHLLTSSDFTVTIHRQRGGRCPGSAGHRARRHCRAEKDTTPLYKTVGPPLGLQFHRASLGIAANSPQLSPVFATPAKIPVDRHGPASHTQTAPPHPPG